MASLDITLRQQIVGLCLSAGALMGAQVLAASPIEVAVVTVKSQSITTGLTMDGVIQPVRQSTLSAQTSGRVASFLVKAGDRVRAGQLLATIDDRETQVGMQRSQAQQSQAEAELFNAQANAQRTNDLYLKGYVSKAALDTANAQLKALQAGRDQARAGVRQSALTQGFTRVTAPYDGWVLQSLSEAGDLAVPGKPLLTLYAPLPLRAVVQLPASRADSARRAQSVQVQVPDGKGSQQWITPTATTVLPTADPVSQTIEWRLELPASGVQSLTPGQQVSVRFAGGSADRLMIPSAAIVRRGELTAVYVTNVVTNNVATTGTAPATPTGFSLKAVRLGVDHGAAGVEVLAGLSSGERVALDPVRAGLTGARALEASQ